MKLNLKAAFDTILGFHQEKSRINGQPASTVILMREAQFPTLEELRLAAERAFETPFSIGKGSRHFVLQAVLFTLMKAGPHTLSFLNYRKPYGDDPDFPKSFLANLPKESQRRAWSEHSAWTAINYAKGVKDPEIEHCVLAKLCAELINENCTGVYIPSKRLLIPYEGSTKTALQEFASKRPLMVV